MNQAAELISRFQASSDERERNLIFARIYGRYENLVLHTIAQVTTVSEQQNRDLAQDTWLIIARELDGFEWKDEKGFINWVYTIAHNVALKAVRKAQRQPDVRTDLEDVKDVAVEAQPEENPDDKEAVKQLLEILKDIDPKALDFIRQKLLEGKTYGQMGAQSGKTEDAVRKRVSRALEKLRNHLKKQYGVTSLEEWLEG